MATATQKRQFDPHMGRKFEKGNRASVGMGRGGKIKALKDAYQHVVEEIEPKTGETYAMLIARQVRAKALKGNMPAVMELTNRLHGKPTQPLAFESPINDDTAKTIAELATTFRLLDPSEHIEPQATILVAQQVNVHPIDCTCHTCELNRQAKRLPEAPKDGGKIMSQSDTAKLMQELRESEAAKLKDHEGRFPSI